MSKATPARWMQYVGTAVVTLQDTQFADAYQQGYTRFRQQQQQHEQISLTDWDISLFLMTITSVQHGSRWNAGYITGWMAALFEQPAHTTTAVVLVEMEGKNEETL